MTVRCSRLVPVIELGSNALIFILVLHISAINDIVTVINIHLCPYALILVFVLRIPAASICHTDFNGVASVKI